MCARFHQCKIRTGEAFLLMDRRLVEGKKKTNLKSDVCQNIKLLPRPQRFFVLYLEVWNFNASTGIKNIFKNEIQNNEIMLFCLRKISHIITEAEN